MSKKISELPVTSPVQDTDYTIVYDLETGQTKRATKADFKGSKGDPGTAGTSGHTIKDEGTPLTARTGLNFVGAGVTATDDAGNDQTIVTIPLTDISGKENTGVAASAVSSHSALVTGVHGLVITAGKTITVPDNATVSGANTGDQLLVKTFSWVISNPASGVVYGPRLKEAQTVTRIDSSVDMGSVVFNVNKRNNFTAAGVNILAAQQTSLASGVSSSSFNDSSLPADNWLALNISSASSNPTQLVVTISTTTP